MADYEHVEAPSDEEIVQGASRRARVLAFVTSRPGKEFSRTEVAEGIGSPNSVAEIGVICSKLALAGQIGTRQDGAKKFYFAGGHGGAVQLPSPRPPKATRSDKGKRRVPKILDEVEGILAAARPVEIVVAGITVAIGRNPNTGRVRIEIEA